MRKLLTYLAIFIILLAILVGSGIFKVNWEKFGITSAPTILNEQRVKIVNEGNWVIDIVKKSSPSVVTVGIIQSQPVSQDSNNMFGNNFFDPFGFFGEQSPAPSTPSRKTEQDIGTGFIIAADGLIVTNKHVVSDTTVKYQVFLKDDKNPYAVEKIYRDPVNDLAILQINPPAGKGLPSLSLGDSSKLQVGQYVVAIGTALGEFRNTVTTGVISGLGRGITAGDPLGGETEQLDNVIQTDAAINPGNSGGPLLDTAGNAIGVNAAVAQGGQNVGFALPINLVKQSLDNFNKTGKFSRPYLGVQYQMVTRRMAILNDMAEGAYVQKVVDGSPAAQAGIQDGDIITKVDGKKIDTTKDTGLSSLISGKKVGDHVSVEYVRGEEKKTAEVTLGEAGDQ